MSGSTTSTPAMPVPWLPAPRSCVHPSTPTTAPANTRCATWRAGCGASATTIRTPRGELFLRWQVDAGQLLEHLDDRGVRSEEHTSELTSIMRISYAVLCLK